MKRFSRGLLCLCLTLALLPAALPRAAAEESAPPEVRVYVDGLLRLRGFDCGGTLYLSAAELCTVFALPFEAALGPSGYTLRLSAFELSAPADGEVLTASGRYLYCPGGYRVIGERVCFPVDVSVSSGSPSALRGGAPTPTPAASGSCRAARTTTRRIFPPTISSG